MNLIILASSLVFIIVLAIFNKRTARLRKRKSEEFWKREREANFVRKKSLEDLEYISIPFSSFPMDVATDDDIIASCHRDLESLRDEKIVNFT